MKNLNEFTIELQDLFAGRLKSVFIFGSRANTEITAKTKNIDLFIILDVVRSEDLTKLFPYTQKWCALGNSVPVVMGKDEFIGMTDIFSIEYSDIKWNYQLLYGEDNVEAINVNYFDLRLQCERELKSLILKLRSFYLEHGRSKSAVTGSMKKIARTVVVIFRALLRLKNMTPSVYKQDVVEDLATVLRFDKQFFRKLIEYKEDVYSFTTSEIFEFYEYIIDQLTKILKQVSEM